jgi:hypothetical protein
MKMTEIRSIAKGRGINSSKMRKVDLIRTIQEDEHNDPCYSTEYVRQCGQDGCLWRRDCEKSIS